MGYFGNGTWPSLANMAAVLRMANVLARTNAMNLARCRTVMPVSLLADPHTPGCASQREWRLLIAGCEMQLLL